MKELSIEEKAKAYDEALHKAKRIINVCVDDNTECRSMIACIQQIFPELKEESEDERIRKKICKLLWDNAPYEEAQEYIAWLEKQCEKKSINNLTQQETMDIAVAKCFEQGEQKPVIEMKTPEESLGIDSNTYNKIVDECVYGEQNPGAWSEEDELMLVSIIQTLKLTNGAAQMKIDWLKSIKERILPKSTWSEKDEVKMNRIVACLENLNVADNDILLKDVDWLKSLRPQSQWKPSDEQIEILDMVLTNASMDDNIARILRELREQLKKLKG